MTGTVKRNKRLKYGEKTVPIRVPASMVPQIEALLEQRQLVETEWCRAVLPPVAQELVRFIADRLIEPQLAILEAIKDQDGAAFKAAYDEMSADIEAMRTDYLYSVSKGLVESLGADGRPSLKLLENGENV